MSTKTITDWTTGYEALRGDKAAYVRCDVADIPAGVRFDVPGRNQGQMIEVAYGRLDRTEASYGDPWRRTTNERHEVVYERLVWR